MVAIPNLPLDLAAKIEPDPLEQRSQGLLVATWGRFLQPGHHL